MCPPIFTLSQTVVMDLPLGVRALEDGFRKAKFLNLLMMKPHIVTVHLAITSQAGTNGGWAFLGKTKAGMCLCDLRFVLRYIDHTGRVVLIINHPEMAGGKG